MVNLQVIKKYVHVYNSAYTSSDQNLILSFLYKIIW